MDYPKTQIEFEQMFSTEGKCLSYLGYIRFENGYTCPKCNGKQHWKSKDGIYVCKQCNYQLSLTAGTVFHKSRIGLTVLFRAMWYIVAQKKGVSALGLQKIMGIKRYETTWDWLHKFRSLMVLAGRKKLSGIVEVDETLVGGKRSGKRGRGAEGKTLVIVAVEVLGKKTGRTRLAVIDDASRTSINAFIKSNIETGTKVRTDGWLGYTDLTKMKYTREIHTDKVLQEGGELLPYVHRIASLLKRWLLGTHQNHTSPGKLNSYLDEFVFRYNRRHANSRGLLFQTLMQQAVTQKPMDTVNAE